MKIYVVRHGETNYNVRNLCNQDSSADCHLTSKGREQARIVAQKLRGIEFDAVYISHFPRTKETAEIIHSKAEMIVDERIDDRLVGDEFEGKKVSDFKKAIVNDKLNTKFPGGESYKENKQRVFAFIDGIKKSNYKNVLIVGHSNTVKLIRGYFKQVPDEEIVSQYVDNCSVLEYQV